MAKKKKGFFESLFSFKMPESRKKLTKKFKDASKKKSSQSLESAKKSVNEKIKKNRKDTFGTKKTGIPEKTQSKKRLKNVFENEAGADERAPTKIVKAPGGGPKKKPNIAKLKYGMGSSAGMDSGKVKQGPPPPPKKKAPIKKKSKSNISNSSSYDADFTKKNLEKRGLNPKGRMSKENMAKTTAAKNKKIAKGMDFGQKKKKVEAPMYESKGTMGGVKMKMAKGYSAGGRIFTGR